MFKTFIYHLFDWKRLETILWYGLSMVASDMVTQIVNNISSFHLQSWETVALGLVLAQVSKALINTKTKLATEIASTDTTVPVDPTSN